MNPERLSMLARRYAPAKNIVDRAEDVSGNYYKLECGHYLRHERYFPLSKARQMYCVKCGEKLVLNLAGKFD